MNEERPRLDRLCGHCVHAMAWPQNRGFVWWQLAAGPQVWHVYRRGHEGTVCGRYRVRDGAA